MASEEKIGRRQITKMGNLLFLKYILLSDVINPENVFIIFYYYQTRIFNE